MTNEAQTADLTTMAALPDEQILAAVARGEHLALRVLYERYAGAVFALALRMVADREVAEEVTQEVFLRIWRHARSYDPARGRVPTWVLGLTHHLSIDQIRRRKVQAQPMPVTDDGEPLSTQMPDLTVDVEREVWGAERHQVLTAALGHLPAPQREVIEHAYYRGLTQVEIANRVGIPLGTVKTRLRLGLRKLREILQSQGLSPATV
jgi:RNA polymerase sigma-70 factor (ECF subfamily)